MDNDNASASVLVVEDDISIRYVISTILSKANYRVHSVSTVDEALKVMAGKPPDIVCCDLMMPGKNGLDFLAHLRQDPLLKSIPTVMISASGERDKLKEAEALGAKACLSKPFGKNQLLSIVEEVLRDR